MKAGIVLLIKGIGVGAANIIPGVSGGTLLWSLGLYSAFIRALKAWDIETLQCLFRGRFRDVLRRIQARWLAVLGLGITLGLLGLARIIDPLLSTYPVPTYAFFFGLVAGSVYLLAREIPALSWGAVLAFFIGLMTMPTMLQLAPAQADSSFFYLFLCGIAAMAGMLLPGFSGSLLLIVLGNYGLVVEAIARMDMSVLLPFSLGMAIGLVSMARLIFWFLNAYRTIAVALITGLIVGALPHLWPWGQEPYGLPPSLMDPYLVFPLLLAALGVWIAVLANAPGPNSSSTVDVSDSPDDAVQPE